MPALKQFQENSEQIGGSNAPRILIVEDDESCALRLTAALSAWVVPIKNARCIVDKVEDIKGARAYLEADSVDIYIVDLNLKEDADYGAGSDTVGKSFIREIVRRTNAGIIVYSNLPAESEEAALLCEGADDYVQKIDNLNDKKKRNAVDVRIKARVLAVWRRVELTRLKTSQAFAHTNKVFLIGDWRFIIGDRVLHNHKGDAIRLSQTEHAFLRYVCVVEGHEVDLDTFNSEILNRRPLEYVNRIDNFIYRLRSKLGESVQFLSIRDNGYKLIDVKELKPYCA